MTKSSPAGGVDPAELQRHAGEVVGVGRDERPCGVADQALQGVAGFGDGLPDQALEGLLSLDVGHHDVHHVVGALVHADQQRRLLPGGEDRLAVHAEEPAPGGRSQFGGDLDRGLGPCAELVHPAVQREPPDRTAEALLEEHGQHAVGGEALHVQPHGLLHGVVGEPGPRAGHPP